MLRKIKNLKHLLVAILAVCLYRFPCRNLTVIGVTGTDGKTTTTHLIGSVLREAGIKAATISTLGAWLGSEQTKLSFHMTTPDHMLLQKLLRQIADKRYTHVVLEATSMGLDQHRLFGCNFKVGVMTNVTHDHLDYHLTWEKYLEAKSKLFNGTKFAILNKDDKSYEFLSSKLQAQSCKILDYGIATEADITPKSYPFSTKLIGGHNQYNCLAAIAAAKSLGIEDKKIKEAIANFSGLPGRLEEIDEGQDFKVFVDFAHTPAAFEKVLTAVREQTKGSVIHVFGCTGNRDKSKRPGMGEISARLSDRIILTHEDTYGEDPANILAEIEPGVKKGGKNLDKNYWKVLDRQEAIKKAFEMARKGDSVIITGVGHQTTLNIGKKEVPWSDQETARKLIRQTR